MIRFTFLILAAFFSVALIVSPSQALKRLMPAPASIPQRVALAETIVLGKVTRIEGQSIMMSESPGSEKREFFVAFVHVQESLVGADGLTDLKVAFPAQPINRLEFDGGSNDYLLQLETDQEVCLFLKPHHAGEFMVGATYYPALNKKDSSFEANWKLTQKCVKLMANPEQGLVAQDGENRFLTAAMLILRYRTPPIFSKGQPKQEAIHAKQSRLILQALAEADWQKPMAELGYEIRPDTLFGRLNLTAKDGWNQSVSPEAAKKWLKEHAEKYRIRKYVPLDK
jgi:hypothetical protein